MEDQQNVIKVEVKLSLTIADALSVTSDCRCGVNVVE